MGGWNRYRVSVEFFKLLGFLAHPIALVLILISGPLFLISMGIPPFQVGVVAIFIGFAYLWAWVICQLQHRSRLRKSL